MRAIRADKSAQLRLLDLQTVDTTLAQLNHRRQALPQHATISKLRAERAALASDLVGADTRVSDLEMEQAKAETDLEPVRERLSRNQTRITNGAVADPKALSSMVAEVDHLKKRISDLEDAELEVMEQLEAAMSGREKLRARAEQVDAVILWPTPRSRSLYLRLGFASREDLLEHRLRGSPRQVASRETA